MMPIEHIHPMIVHFPIVLLMVAALADLTTLLRGGDLAGSGFFARLSAGALGLAALGAVAAFLFGDIAYDAALSKGFPEAALETHEGLGTMTTVIIVALALVRLGALWRKFGLAGARGWLLTTGSVAGVAVMILTAYHGGQLVYQLGVNVAMVTPLGQ